MVAQANAQSIHYTAVEDSDDDLHQYSYEYEDPMAEEYKGQDLGVPPFGAIPAMGSVTHVTAGNY